MQTPRLNEKAIMKAGLVKMQIYRDDFIKDPACNLLGDPPNLRFVTEAPQAKPQLQHPVQPQPQYPSGNIGPFQPGMGAIWPGMGFGQPQLPMQPQQPQPQGMFAPFGVEQPQPQPVMGFGQPQPPMQPQQPQQQGMFDPFGFGQPQPQPSPSPQFPMFGYNTGAGNANVPLAQPQPQSQRQALFLHPDIQENLNNGELLLQQPVFPLPIAGVPYDEQQENHADVMEFEDEAPHLPPAQPFGEEDPLRRGVVSDRLALQGLCESLGH
ncbi:hypothetical protein QBC34DRAFT_408610 [Podospora aff. communis PSN243]|uniref:Uncharacterized protein n=1 Tax=Podospora aff. communis PSN243 TaxID=3040156 RepID=A0AAV9GHL8_9PEZI|nr:hypothetical protein QBC34DRAFT_408610 [Podospora aff. communis PSN243]